MKLKTVLFLFGSLAILLTIIPLIAVDYWWIRMFDFPHTQLTALTLIAIITYLFCFDIRWTKDYFFMAMMLACFAFQLIKIIPYTPLYPYDILPAQKQEPKRQLSIFTANVLQSNKKMKMLLNDIKKEKPDVVLLCEVNAKWLKTVAPYMERNYRYTHKVPLENTYGMALYSKRALINPTTHFLVDDSIPSIHTKLVLKSGDTIQVYSIHPTPPLPQHNPRSTDRDTEMMLTARMSRKNRLPVIVMGDFNDVAWSTTTALFKKTGELLDPRIGRGFFNTFSAKSFIFRWPLDHIFASSEFRLIELLRGDDINSDHFPSYAKFSFEPDGKQEQMPEPPSEAQLQNAEDQIKSFQERLD